MLALSSFPIGIAKALGTKIYCDEKKFLILEAQDDPELHALLTRKPLEAQVHVCWLQNINRDAMSDYLAQFSSKKLEGGFTKVIGLRPTGESKLCNVSSDLPLARLAYLPLHPGWTYKGESSRGEQTPTVARILERERARTFSPAGMCKAIFISFSLRYRPGRVARVLTVRAPSDPQRDSTSTCLGYGVPYSEHSSFYE
jgi:DNA cross-link repair 1A protein